MMQNPHPAKRRVIALLVFFGAFLLLFAAVLYDAQIRSTAAKTAPNPSPVMPPARR